MRVPMRWLAEYCDPGMDARVLADRLAMTGTEVERVVRHGAPSAENLVVGKVVGCERHPDADRLSVCAVDVGEGDPVTIVCGAANVAAGQTVAVARPGAVLPGRDGGEAVKLKTARLRGVESHGMILAEDELSIGGDHSGIMELDADPALIGRDLPPGTPLGDVFVPGEDVLELEITPNRPDCLGVYGVAREVHAVTGNPLAPLPKGPAPTGDESFPIEVRDHEMCPRFTARIYRGVKVGPSPLWLKQRLSAAGQRPINNVVDITNYLMLLTGQPMHAFDMDKIRGGRLVIRNALPGEKVETLDGVERECDEQTVLVCDGEGPSAIAGIMGGAVSEVSVDTVNVLLEVATWNGPNIHRTSQKLGLRSEAGGRFEKGLSPQTPLEVQDLAAKMIIELTGAEAVSDTIDVSGPRSEPAPIRLRAARLRGLLGADIPLTRCAEILNRLDFAVEIDESGGELIATPPHFRAADVTREADLIEEIARIEGVDTIPATLPSAPSAIGRLTPAQRLRRATQDLLTAVGFCEAITWSFIGDQALVALIPDTVQTTNDSAATVSGGETPLRIANPLSEDMAVMRPTALPGLLHAARHNLARGADAVRLFEIGAVYGGDVASPAEHTAITLLMTGPSAPATWRDRPENADFFALKGVVRAITEAARVDGTYARQEPSSHPYLIPGRSAVVAAGGVQLGRLGELHPLVAKRFDLPGAVVAELNLDALAALIPQPVAYSPISPFPPAREDIAVVVDEARSSAEVIAVVRDAGGELLTGADVFDVYTGEQVEAGRRSLAVRLTYSAPDRTLTDDELAEARGRITRELEAIGGTLRV